MKKNYQKPAMRIVTVQHHQHLLVASVTGVDGGNTGIGIGGGSSGSNRAPSFGDWDDWDE